MSENLLRLDGVSTKKSVRTDEGFLRCSAVVARAGILEYRNADGTMRRELRRPEQVFRQDALDSFNLVPFVDGHPYADGGLVTVKNARRLMRGMVGKASQEGNSVVQDVVVMDESTIKDIEAGKKQLSAGYKIQLLEQPGVWKDPETGKDERYDAEQINIRGNHIALVKSGRAGNAELRLDENLSPVIQNEESDMIQVRLDNGTTVEMSKEAADAYARLGQRQDEAEKLFVDTDAKLQTITKERDTLLGEKEGMQKRLDEATDPAKQAAAVKARVALVTSAQAVLPKSEHVKLDSMTDQAIMEAVIRTDAKDPEMKFEGQSVERIQGRFDQVMDSRKSKKVESGIGKEIIEARHDAADEDEDESPAESRKKKLTERYKQPINPMKAGK